MTTDELPLLLLDVDGVVCPLGKTATDQVAIASTYLSLSHHRSLPVWLAELAEVFELVWATTWEHDANAILAPLLGLPDLPVIGFKGAVVGPGETVKLRRSAASSATVRSRGPMTGSGSTRSPGPPTGRSRPSFETLILPWVSHDTTSTHCLSSRHV